MLDGAICSFIETVYVLFIPYNGCGPCIDVINSSLLYVLYYNYTLYTFVLVPLLACKDKKSLS